MTAKLHPDFLRLPIAHRGLHDRSNGIVENSPSAFGAAMDAGYGIELDLQLSGDGQAMVFHDETLDRLTAEGLGLISNLLYPKSLFLFMSEVSVVLCPSVIAPPAEVASVESEL